MSNPNVAWAAGVLDFDAQQYANAEETAEHNDDDADQRQRTWSEQLYRLIALCVFCLLFPFIALVLGLHRIYARLRGQTTAADHEPHFVGDDYSDVNQQQAWKESQQPQQSLQEEEEEEVAKKER
jgi:hypothetical protein